MQDRARRVEVQDQTVRSLAGHRLHELIEQYLVQSNDVLPADAVLEPAQGRGAGQISLALGRRLHGKVLAQFVMVIQVLVAGGQGTDALPDHVFHGVPAAGRPARVPDRTGYALEQPSATAGLAEQGNAGIAGGLGTIEIGIDSRPFSMSNKIGFGA